MTARLSTIADLEAAGYTQLESLCSGCGFWAEPFEDIRNRKPHLIIENLTIEHLMALMRCPSCPGKGWARAGRPWRW